MKVARVYMRVSTAEQDIERQNVLVGQARQAGYYIAGIYKDKDSGARVDRPELLRMIADLQPEEVLIAEKIDRISRLPLPEAELLIATIREKGALLAIPGIVDFSQYVADSEGVTKIVLENLQDMLLKIALQTARDEYEDRRERQRQGIAKAKKEGKYKGRQANHNINELIIKLRPNHTIEETAKLAGCSQSQVKRIWRLYNKQ